MAKVAAASWTEVEDEDGMLLFLVAESCVIVRLGELFCI